MGPTPNPTTNSVIVNRETSSLTPNSLIGPSMPAVTTALSNATAKHVTATINVQYHLYTLLQFLGFSGSPGVNVTSSYRSLFPVLFVTTGCRPLGRSVRYSPMLASEVRVR